MCGQHSFMCLLFFFVLLDLSYDCEGNDSSNLDNTSNPGIGIIWENFWKLSCEYVNTHLETHHKVKRSPSVNNFDFDDPEQLFNYLYPLAQVKMKDLNKKNEYESGRSNKENESLHEYTLSTLIADFLEFWQVECELIEESMNKDNETGNQDDSDNKEDDEELEDIEAEFDDDENESEFYEEINEQVQEGPGQNIQRSGRKQKINPLEATRFSDSGNIRPDQTPSMRSYFNSLRSASNPPNGSSSSSKNLNRRRRRRKKKPQAGLSSRSDSNDQSTTEGSTLSTTTTAATPKAAEEDSFFASYGGDIEYFFPLLSFGIPFDGEITFLGFHGFKGIFPYRR